MRFHPIHFNNNTTPYMDKECGFQSRAVVDVYISIIYLIGVVFIFWRTNLVRTPFSFITPRQILRGRNHAADQTSLPNPRLHSHRVYRQETSTPITPLVRLISFVIERLVRLDIIDNIDDMGTKDFVQVF